MFYLRTTFWCFQDRDVYLKDLFTAIFSVKPHEKGLEMMVAANRKICVVENIYKYKMVTSVLTHMV